MRGVGRAVPCGCQPSVRSGDAIRQPRAVSTSQVPRQLRQDPECARDSDSGARTHGRDRREHQAPCFLPAPPRDSLAFQVHAAPTAEQPWLCKQSAELEGPV